MGVVKIYKISFRAHYVPGSRLSSSMYHVSVIHQAWEISTGQRTGRRRKNIYIYKNINTVVPWRKCPQNEDRKQAPGRREGKELEFSAGPSRKTSLRLDLGAEIWRQWESQPHTSLWKVIPGRANGKDTPAERDHLFEVWRTAKRPAWLERKRRRWGSQLLMACTWHKGSWLFANFCSFYFEWDGKPLGALSKEETDSDLHFKKMAG